MRASIRIGLCVAGLGIVLGGCVSTSARRENPAELKARSEQAVAACRAQPLTTFVARAQCLNDAALIAAPVSPNPDLLQRALAARLDIAGRVDRKEITPEAGAKEYGRIEAQLAAEGQKRLADGE